MASELTFSRLLHLRKSDFARPDRMADAILFAFDRFVGIMGVRPVILSTFRDGDPREHGKGTAIDAAWPGIEPLAVWEKARAAGLFHGLGVYLNEKGATSFHFDTRVDRTVADPATWGAMIEPGIDAETGRPVRRYEYLSAGVVLDQVKKKALWLIGPLLLWGLVLLLRRRNP